MAKKPKGSAGEESEAQRGSEFCLKVASQSRLIFPGDG